MPGSTTAITQTYAHASPGSGRAFPVSLAVPYIRTQLLSSQCLISSCDRARTGTWSIGMPSAAGACRGSPPGTQCQPLHALPLSISICSSVVAAHQQQMKRLVFVDVIP